MSEVALPVWKRAVQPFPQPAPGPRKVTVSTWRLMGEWRPAGRAQPTQPGHRQGPSRTWAGRKLFHLTQTEGEPQARRWKDSRGKEQDGKARLRSGAGEEKGGKGFPSEESGSGHAIPVGPSATAPDTAHAAHALAAPGAPARRRHWVAQGHVSRSSGHCTAAGDGWRPKCSLRKAVRKKHKCGKPGLTRPSKHPGAGLLGVTHKKGTPQRAGRAPGGRLVLSHSSALILVFSAGGSDGHRISRLASLIKHGS